MILNNGDNEIGIFLERGLPTGTWTVRLHGASVNNRKFHAWIERDDDGQSNFMPPNDNTHTLGSLSCGYKSIVVGSYDAHIPIAPLSRFSSAGPTKDGRQKPEISAPEKDVFAAATDTITSDTTDREEWNDRYGLGRIDANKAVEEIVLMQLL